MGNIPGAEKVQELILLIDPTTGFMLLIVALATLALGRERNTSQERR